MRSKEPSRRPISCDPSPLTRRVRSPAAIDSATERALRTGSAIVRASQIAASTPGRPTKKAEAAAPAACHQSTSRLESISRLTSTAPEERPSDRATGAATRYESAVKRPAGRPLVMLSRTSSASACWRARGTSVAMPAASTRRVTTGASCRSRICTSRTSLPTISSTSRRTPKLWSRRSRKVASMPTSTIRGWSMPPTPAYLNIRPSWSRCWDFWTTLGTSPVSRRWKTCASGCLAASGRNLNGVAGRSVSMVPTASVPVTRSWSMTVSSATSESCSTIASRVRPAFSATAT